MTKFFRFGVEPDAPSAMSPTKTAGKENKYAFLAWRTRVLCRAGSNDLTAPFDPEEITPEFLRPLVGLSIRKTGPARPRTYWKATESRLCSCSAAGNPSSA